MTTLKARDETITLTVSYECGRCMKLTQESRSMRGLGYYLRCTFEFLNTKLGRICCSTL
jgi:hypothetical protein